MEPVRKPTVKLARRDIKDEKSDGIRGIEKSHEEGFAFIMADISYISPWIASAGN